MVAGRPNTPASIKAAKNNPGKRVLNFGALKVAVEIPKKPARITGEGAKEWKRLAKVLEDNSLITLLDRTALMIYVDAFGMYEAAMKKLKNDEVGIVNGMLQTTGTNGYQTLSSTALVLRDARSTMMTIMTQFGMTPSSREKVSIKVNQAELWPSREQLN